MVGLIDAVQRSLAILLSLMVKVVVALLTINVATTVLSHESDLPKSAETFIKRHCYECHGDGADEGDFQIDELSRDFTDPATAIAWRDALHLVQLGEMPPPEQPKPRPASLRNFVKAINSALQSAAIKAANSGPRLRRLSRSAMDHAAQDLMGTDLRLSEGLPEDPTVSGFDNFSSTMVHSKEFIEALQKNARAIAENVITKRRDPRKKSLYTGKKIVGGRSTERSGRTVVLYGSQFRNFTAWPQNFEAPYSGRYRVKVTAFERNSLDDLEEYDIKYELAPYKQEDVFKRAQRWIKQQRLPRDRRRQASLISAESKEEAASGTTITGRLLGRFDVAPEMSTTEVLIDMKEGESFYIVASDCERRQFPPWAKITSGEKKLKNKGFSGKEMVIDGKILLGEQLHIDRIEIQGPLTKQWPPRAMARLFPKGFDEPLTDRRISFFLARAFRGRVDNNTVKLYSGIYNYILEQNKSPLQAGQQLVQAVLCSPRFLYARPPKNEDDSFAVASRLSFFLWNTVPDDVLLKAADRGELKDPAGMTKQVRRMIADPRCRDFIRDFTGQWLGLRKVGAMLPDPELFPSYEAVLETSMREETEEFINYIVTENRPVTDLIAPGYAMLNGRLAEHYGIKGVKGAKIRKVKVPKKDPRGGLLGQASILTITSNGTSTSPVVRGVWVLENLLDSPPAPPPPDVPAIEPDVRGATTIRDQLAKHRDIETCNQCHRRIDPWGFGLENFDPIGQWRTHYIGKKQRKPVDATGTMPNGDSFKGVTGVQKALLQRERQLTHALAAKLLSHATGQPTSITAKLALDEIVDANMKGKNGVLDLIEKICVSPVFLE
ncbi:MAG: DUF1592 domain-containing protein [Planctomycetota bacterium]